MNEQKPDPGLLQILASYLSISMYGIQKTVLARRGYNQWQTDNAFSGLMQNYTQFKAQATQPMAPTLTPEQLMAGLSQLAPQQGQQLVQQPTQQTTQPPPPPPPGHYDWDQAAQAYVWVANP